MHRGDGVHGGPVGGRVRRDLLYDAGQAGVLGGPGTVVTAVAVDEVLARLAERSLLTFSLNDQAVFAHRLVAISGSPWAQPSRCQSCPGR